MSPVPNSYTFTSPTTFSEHLSLIHSYSYSYSRLLSSFSTTFWIPHFSPSPSAFYSDSLTRVHSYSSNQPCLDRRFDSRSTSYTPTTHPLRSQFILVITSPNPRGNPLPVNLPIQDPIDRTPFSLVEVRCATECRVVLDSEAAHRPHYNCAPPAAVYILLRRHSPGVPHLFAIRRFHSARLTQPCSRQTKDLSFPSHRALL